MYLYKYTYIYIYIYVLYVLYAYIPAYAHPVGVGASWTRRTGMQPIATTHGTYNKLTHIHVHSTHIHVYTTYERTYTYDALDFVGRSLSVGVERLQVRPPIAKDAAFVHVACIAVTAGTVGIAVPGVATAVTVAPMYWTF